MNVFLWHVHGSWMNAFVRGRHRYLLPVTPDRGPDGRGRAQTWVWPDSAEEVTREAAADLDVDVVVLQRPRELDHLACEWLGGRQPGRDVPAVYVEHNTPPQGAVTSRHPAADRSDVRIVHVTYFNELFWDCGRASTTVIEHGIVDPGYRYTGELDRCVVELNEPVRRTRVAGTDLIPRFERAAPVDVFGIAADEIGGLGNLPQAELHDEIARRRVYLHPFRWTSLGLTLLEAMHLGVPVVAVATTEVAEAVPPGAGAISTNVDRLVAAASRFVHDPALAREVGCRGREAALRRYGLDRFLDRWDALLQEVVW